MASKSKPPDRRSRFRETTLRPVKRVKWHQRLIIPAEGAVVCAIISERLYLYETHYNAENGKLHYCPGEPYCHFCAFGWEPKIYGYAAVQSYPSGKLYLLCLPQEALTHCDKLVDAKASLRGSVLRIRRSIPRKNGPVMCMIDDKRCNPSQLPKGWDIHKDVMHRFGYAESDPTAKGMPVDGEKDFADLSASLDKRFQPPSGR